jgi:tetratricopeptide (TPR) repeat protein
METLITTFVIPDGISAGLAKGVYERVGGVIRDKVSKQVVAWLREGLNQTNGSFLPPRGFPSVDPITGALSLAAQLANAAVTAKGFGDVNRRLDGVQQQMEEMGQSLQNMQGMLHMTSATSILNLGVSVIGFAVIAHRLNELEQRLQQSQELLNLMNRKIDLGFYAKFRAALDLAQNAFRMNKPENRRSSALAAINLFLEAEHIYADYVDQELEQKSQIADEYLLTLSLAYLAEARCYLELEEWDTALERFQEGAVKVRSRIHRYVELLLTSNPAAYLDPEFKGQIDLRRVTRIYQWLDPSLDENAVFELQRDNLFNLRKEQGTESGYKWVNSLPAAIIGGTEVKGNIFGNREQTKQEAMKRLPQVMEVMESMIETNYRFEGYQTEIKAITQLGISFHDWVKLAPGGETPANGANLMFIIPAQPIAA